MLCLPSNQPGCWIVSFCVAKCCSLAEPAGQPPRARRLKGGVGLFVACAIVPGFARRPRSLYWLGEVCHARRLRAASLPLDGRGFRWGWGPCCFSPSAPSPARGEGVLTSPCEPAQGGRGSYLPLSALASGEGIRTVMASQHDAARADTCQRLTSTPFSVKI